MPVADDTVLSPIQTRPGIVEVHSNSAKVGCNGIAYNEWWHALESPAPSRLSRIGFPSPDWTVPSVPLGRFSFGGAMIAATEIAMPAFHGSDDDFLFQIQHPPAELPSSDSPANMFLERIVRRIRNGREINIYEVPSGGTSFWADILRTLKQCWPFGR